MPMLTTSVIVRPVAPLTRACAQRVGEARASARARASRPASRRDRRACTGRCARSAVCSAARFSVDVDALAGHEPRDPAAKVARLGERDEQPHRLVGDEVLRIVEQQIAACAME